MESVGEQLARSRRSMPILRIKYVHRSVEVSRQQKSAENSFERVLDIDEYSSKQ